MLIAALQRMDPDELRRLAALGGARSTPAWSRDVRSAAPTTCTGRCVRSTWTISRRASWVAPRSAARSTKASSPTGSPAKSSKPGSRELRDLIEEEIRRLLVADRGVEAMARTLRKPLARGHRVHARIARGDDDAAARGVPADARARGSARAAAQAQEPRHARLPQDRARVAVVRRRAGRAEVPQPASVEARGDGRRRHLRFRRQLRPLHAHVRVRDGEPVLEGAVMGVHRRHRRGHPLLPGVRRRLGGRAPRQHRSRRGVGRRPLRLRPRVRGVPSAPLPRDHAQDVDHPARRRARNNYHASQAWVVEDLADAGPPRVLAGSRAAGYWDTGDSIVSEYAKFCAGIFECRNLRQLQQFVAQVAEAG